MRLRLGSCSLIAAALFALLAGGCSASSQYMTETTTLPLRAPSNQALLVFVRPSSLGFAVKFTVVDSRGRYLGDALASGYWAVPLEPGPIAIYASGENDAAMKGEVAAGRVYYVEVETNMGAFSARVDLLPVKPGTDRWTDKREWLADSTPYRVNLAAAQTALTREEMKERVDEGEEAWKDYDAEEIAEHTLAASDCDQPPAMPPPAQPATVTTAPVAPAQPAPVAPAPAAPPTAEPTPAQPAPTQPAPVQSEQTTPGA